MSGSDSSELETLRAVARAAAGIFEADGRLLCSPQDILREALLCAQSDFQVIECAGSSDGGVVDGMVFRRAELRIDLSLALAAYCEKFGWPERAGEEADSESEAAE